MHITPLPQRGLFTVTGEDHIPFLQGLVSADVRRTEKGEPVYAALLTPQGKFLHDFFLLPWAGGIGFDCEKARMDDLIKRLSMYKLRSKVAVTPLTDWVAMAAWGGENLPGLPDPRLAALGNRLYGEAKDLPAGTASPGDYDRHRLSLGVPDGSRDMIVDKSFLLECGFEELHGVDFAKGCYIGQEVTARTHYRGQVKKTFFTVTGNAPLPAPGTPIHSGEDAAGEMRSSAGGTGLAILRIELVEKGGALHAGGQPLTARKPAWAGT